MPSSPHMDPPSWADRSSAVEHDLFVGEPIPSPRPGDAPFDQEAPAAAQHTFAAEATGTEAIDDRRPAPTFDDDVYESAFVARTTETEYAASPGMPARGVILLSSASAIACAGLDFALTGGLSIFFDLCFVVVCLVGAMAVRRRDIFTTGVLAPLVYGGVMAVVSFASPETFATSGGISKVFLSGLAAHAGALVAGYGVALASVAGRVSATRPVP